MREWFHVWNVPCKHRDIYLRMRSIGENARPKAVQLVSVEQIYVKINTWINTVFMEWKDFTENCSVGINVVLGKIWYTKNLYLIYS